MDFFYYRTALDVDDGFGDRTLVCRECTSFRADSDPRIYAAIKQRTIIGPALQVHTVKCLGMYGIEIHIRSSNSSKKTSWLVICREKKSHVEWYLISSQDPIPSVRNYCERERCCERNRIFCCRDEPVPHRGNSCAAGTCCCESRVLCERDYSHGTKEVD